MIAQAETIISTTILFQILHNIYTINIFNATLLIIPLPFTTNTFIKYCRGLIRRSNLNLHKIRRIKSTMGASRSRLIHITPRIIASEDIIHGLGLDIGVGHIPLLNIV
jgi:hypothetical protein